MRSRIGIVLGLSYIWLVVGFATGTLVLIGPVRWITNVLRAEGVSRSMENLVVTGVIVLFVASSFVLARWLFGKAMRAGSWVLRGGIPAATTLAAAVALWGWSNPAAMPTAAAAERPALRVASGARFRFGAYPDRAKLEALKAEGVTAVVSLQHPAVVPFEPQGIAAERQAAREVGLEFIHVPMLPWVSDNEEALERIRGLVHEGRGTYYIHCGLGRDRVNVARRVIEQAAVDSDVELAGTDGLLEATTFADRVEPFERGPVVELGDEAWLVPYPNEFEFFGYILAGQVEHVLILLDPSDPEQGRWIREAELRLNAYEVPYTHVPLPAGADATRAARAARTLPRPLAVIVARTWPGASVQRERFEAAFGADTAIAAAPQ